MEFDLHIRQRFDLFDEVISGLSMSNRTGGTRLDIGKGLKIGLKTCRIHLGGINAPAEYQQTDQDQSDRALNSFEHPGFPEDITPPSHAPPPATANAILTGSGLCQILGQLQKTSDLS
jgi:hypothetical protein